MSERCWKYSRRGYVCGLPDGHRWRHVARLENGEVVQRFWFGRKPKKVSPEDLNKPESQTYVSLPR